LLSHVLHPLRISECAELLEPLVLDLTDALARDVERAADLVERARLAGEPVPELEDLPLPLRIRDRLGEYA
jgi:hypothetical protein